jgi:hypothetical protein
MKAEVSTEYNLKGHTSAVGSSRQAMQKRTREVDNHNGHQEVRDSSRNSREGAVDNTNLSEDTSGVEKREPFGTCLFSFLAGGANKLTVTVGKTKLRARNQNRWRNIPWTVCRQRRGARSAYGT